jgi:deoxycytidylate deaminase
MPAPKSDPTFIKNKDKYFMGLAKQVATGSTHPIASGGCVIIRDREICGDGRSILADCKVEIDCITYAIATACKRGTPVTGAVIYSTRYPFSASVFQLHLMGIRKIVVLAHEWEPYYKDEFRRAARLARELSIAIEPLFEDEDDRFSTNNQAPRFDDREQQFDNKDLYTHSPTESGSFDATQYDEQIDENNDSTPL